MTIPSLDETARKKRLGQYFTGHRVGRLLAALADAETATTIIDPMVGSADLLVSCLGVGAVPNKLVGLEIDPLALAQAKAALDGAANAELILTDAFSATLPTEQFDLVITNPPYIRYQSTGDFDGLSIPSGEVVRTDLVRAIKARNELDEDARTVLLRAAMRYPGTADIAVPAWILSASLVREGGVLAIIAPQAWLSRNYARSVRQLLDEAFDLEVVVEDGDASWFDDAQVRTHLVLARRKKIGPPAAGRVTVFARATSELEIDGHLHGELDSEHEVGVALRGITSTNSVEVTTGLIARAELDLSVAAAGQDGHVPARVAAALRVAADDIVTRSLESYGWRAGQGLRTGANDFFYIDYVEGAPRPANRWRIKSLPLPLECLLPAVRRQSELGEKLTIDAPLTHTSRIVNLRGWATAADKRRMGATGHVSVLPDDVATWIAEVASSPLSAKTPTKLFPHLAAVAPNSKMDRSGRPVAFWYQLPELAARHRPTLLIGRVCGAQPTTYLNTAGAVVDANFSTLWPVNEDALPAEALLALLHSSWVWASLEATCTVLGGGALKVEATDLRRLALPDLGMDDISRLTTLGQELITHRSEEVSHAIDEAVANAMAPCSTDSRQPMGLREFAETALRHRTHR
ncbi:N-6 DNA methylase [Antrihabitans cavernicola]|uniref:N-6 DNA methylase n=1 Tax=Antrihabitans cavernicola TaxID=2495913 RepID=UPI001659FA3D|nr:N-6 DNA methylase [Spelaeibacter cavernicola]